MARTRTILEQNILTLWDESARTDEAKQIQTIAQRLNTTERKVKKTLEERHDTVRPKKIWNLTESEVQSKILELFFEKGLEPKEIYAQLAYVTLRRNKAIGLSPQMKRVHLWYIEDVIEEVFEYFNETLDPNDTQP